MHICIHTYIARLGRGTAATHHPRQSGPSIIPRGAQCPTPVDLSKSCMYWPRVTRAWRTMSTAQNERFTDYCTVQRAIDAYYIVTGGGGSAIAIARLWDGWACAGRLSGEREGEALRRVFMPDPGRTSDALRSNAVLVASLHMCPICLRTIIEIEAAPPSTVNSASALQYAMHQSVGTPVHDPLCRRTIRDAIIARSS